MRRRPRLTQIPTSRSMDPGASRRSGRGCKANEAIDDLPQLLGAGLTIYRSNGSSRSLPALKARPFNWGFRSQLSNATPRVHPSQGEGRTQIVVEPKPELPLEIVRGSGGGSRRLEPRGSWFIRCNHDETKETRYRHNNDNEGSSAIECI
jgi:hypothetical protein